MNCRCYTNLNPNPNPNTNPTTAQYGKRDGPLPMHIEACAALLLVLGGAVAAPQR